MYKIGVYKVTNPRGLVYVGVSTNIEQRFNKHYKYACNLKSQIKLYNSFVKYDISSHKSNYILKF